MSETVPNLRDLGGTSADGAIIRPGVLLRSAVPLDDDEPPPTVAWPPRRVLDLRSENESGPSHPLTAFGAAVRQISLLEALRPDGPQAADPQTVEQMRHGGLRALYLGMLQMAAGELVQVATAVADADGGPTLVHCTAGKDRTGVAVALMLRAVGVPREAVVADYLRTGEAMPAVVRRLGRLSGFDPARQLPRAYLALPPDAIGAVLDVWDAHEGGTEGWLAEAGADPDLVPRLRTRLLDI